MNHVRPPTETASPASFNLLEAKGAGLFYVSDQHEGITRRKHRSGFVYLEPNGQKIKKSSILKRIGRLVIPPAWSEVWISPRADGHIQAVGRDAKGRKQYCYHVRWREYRDQNKYEHVLAFARKLPAIRRQVQTDLRRSGLPREKVLAAVVRLLEKTLIRIGNEEYARDNQSYGLSTIQNRHVHVRGAAIEFDFRGKSGKEHHILLKDKVLARIVKRCHDLPGQTLFCYRDLSHQVHHVTSQDVNEYIRNVAGPDFTAKDFRTWFGTVLAAAACAELEPGASATQAQRNVVGVIRQVAKSLGNTPAICRKCYIHPEILKGYLEGEVIGKRRPQTKGDSNQAKQLQQWERSVLSLLKRRLG